MASLSILTTSAYALPAYSLVGTFELPAGTVAIDVLPDGRIISSVGDDLYIQNSLNTSGHTKAGSLAPGLISSFGASFVRVSPDGATLAIGDNNFGAGAGVYTFAFSDLNPLAPTGTTTHWPMANTEANWADSNTLYITGVGNSGSGVEEINLSSGTTRTVISNIGGFSGGITTDGTWLYTGNGFDFGPGGSETGEVRAFPRSAINALALGQSLDFEATGIPVVDALSASSLGFDPHGNLLVGGGDAFGSGDAGYAGVIDSAAIEAALLGGSIAPDSAELRLTPRLSTDSYFTRYNHTTNELLITFYDNSTFTGGLTVYRYAIPAPATCIMLAPALIALRRRRSARTHS